MVPFGDQLGMTITWTSAGAWSRSQTKANCEIKVILGMCSEENDFFKLG